MSSADPSASLWCFRSDQYNVVLPVNSKNNKYTYMLQCIIRIAFWISIFEKMARGSHCFKLSST